MATLKILRGKDGILDFGDGRVVATPFSIRSTSDSGLRLTCTFPIVEAQRQIFDGAAPPIRLTGTTSDGRDVTVVGGFMCVRTHGDQVTFVCTGPDPLRLGTPPSTAGLLVCFLTNCFFLGTEVIEVPNGFYRGLIPLEVGGRRFRLELRRSAMKERRDFRETARTGVTAKIVTELADQTEREEVIAIVDRIAALLSLAAGTLVSRISWRICDTDRRVLAETISSPPMRPYKPRLLIDGDDGAALKTFIETAYPIYVAQDSLYRFGKVIHAKSDTASSGFLETRTLAASSLLEYIAGIYARENGLSTVIDRTVFEAGLAGLTKTVDDSLLSVFGDAMAADDREEIAGRARWFNEPSLRQELKFMVKRLGLPFKAGDVNALCDTRNDLAHRMEFHGTTQREKQDEWTRMIHFIDLTLLRLFGYSGRYIDCRTWQTAQLD